MLNRLILIKTLGDNMKKKKEFTPEEMAEFAKYYFRKYFRTYVEAADKFETTSSVISDVIGGKRSPTKGMLDAFDYEKSKIFTKRVKK